MPLMKFRGEISYQRYFPICRKVAKNEDAVARLDIGNTGSSEIERFSVCGLSSYCEQATTAQAGMTTGHAPKVLVAGAARDQQYAFPSRAAAMPTIGVGENC